MKAKQNVVGVKSKDELLEQLKKLDFRLGVGVGAKREREKIASKLADLEQQKKA